MLAHSGLMDYWRLLFYATTSCKEYYRAVKKKKVKAVLSDKSKGKDSMCKKRESKNLVSLNVNKYKGTTHTHRASNVTQESNRNDDLWEKGHQVTGGQGWSHCTLHNLVLGILPQANL